MKRLIGLVVSVVVLALIFANVDRAALWGNLRATRMAPFAFALFLFIPQNVLIAWRWRAMASLFTPMSWGKALSLILAAHSMNVVLPSKMGDLAKAVFLARDGSLDPRRATHLVIFEKMLDIGSLCLLAVGGVALAWMGGIETKNPALLRSMSALTLLLALLVCFLVAAAYFLPLRWLNPVMRFGAAEGTSARRRKIGDFIRSGHEVISLLRGKGANRSPIAAISILLWLLHLLQIQCFFISLNASVPPRAFAALMPLALFIGLLPLSLFGMGTRDAAIIFLFSPWQPAAKLAGAGLYVSLRYIIPAIAGLPFLARHLGMARRGARKSPVNSNDCQN